MNFLVKIKSVIGKGNSSNVFIVKSEKNFIVDAGLNVSQQVLDKVDDVEIDRIILTHRHIDHVGDAKKLSEKLDAPLYAPQKEAIALREADEKTILARSFGVDFQPLEIKELEEEYSGFKILSTPGHTEDSICLYHKDEKILFSGDTVFANGSAGRTDLPTGSKEQLIESIERLNNLDIESMYPGHMSVVNDNASEHIDRTLRFLKMM